MIALNRISRMLLYMTLCCLAMIAVVAFSAPKAHAGPNEVQWDAKCFLAQQQNVDPIGSYNTVPSPHLHSIMGEVITSTTQYADLVAQNNNNCFLQGELFGITSLDMESASWIPTMINRKGGIVPLELKNRKEAYSIYYQSGPNVAFDAVEPWPDRLGVIAGDPHATGPTYAGGRAVVKWRCQARDDITMAGPNPPGKCPAGYHVGAFIFYPNCIEDGYDASEVNDTNHLRYSNVDTGACPAGYYNIPQIVQNIEWQTGTTNGMKLSSGPLYTLHGDYLAGYFADDLQEIVSRCINDGTTCRTGNNS